MLRLFYQDLNQRIECLEQLSDYDSMLKEIRAIKGAAKINKIGSIVETLEDLEEKEKESFLKDLPLVIAELKKFTPQDAASKSQEDSSDRKKGRREQQGDLGMYELFQYEVESQSHLLIDELLALESDQQYQAHAEPMMRAAHSIKGAARVVGLDEVISFSHAMEDCFELMKSGKLTISSEYIDLLLKGVDLLMSLANQEDQNLEAWMSCHRDGLTKLTEVYQKIEEGTEDRDAIESVKKTIEKEVKDPPPAATPYTAPVKPVNKRAPESPASPVNKHDEQFLRVSSKRLNRLMGLAGEAVIESHWLHPFEEDLIQLKQSHQEISRHVQLFRDACKELDLSERAQYFLAHIQKLSQDNRYEIESRISELEMFIRRHSSLSERLYGEVIDIRMRPLADGLKGFPRLVRDIARELGKKARLEIIGKSTPVDRDILEKLETPLNHLIRNAIDHGIEKPEERVKKGKSPEGVIRLEASHRAGMLLIKISDDGQGVDLAVMREKVNNEGLVSPDMIKNLSDHELLDFLFLPGFTTASKLTEISGRGVGLNAVQTMLQEVGGIVRTTTEKDRHLTFNIQLPLTLSVIRSLLVEIAGEPYAFPLARIDRALHIKHEDLETVENRKYFQYMGKNIGLIPSHQILGLPEVQHTGEMLSVVLVSDRMNTYGVIVDQFIGEKDLVVQELDPIIGKIPSISTGAFMEDGAPLLIIDVEDMVQSIDQLLFGGSVDFIQSEKEPSKKKREKSVLIVDDSITVREVECRLLENLGYDVQTAVNGMDGWNALRMGNFDLVITDVDMPRMNGIELTKAIKSDPKLHEVPVMIVSYKDRQEDRKAGLEAGANYYLTKSSFHDETLLEAVKDLIGEPENE